MSLNLSKQELQFQEIKQEIEEYLVQKFGEVGRRYNSASAFGQLLDVQQELFQLNLTILEDSLIESNINTAQRKNSIYSLAQLSGYNPLRSDGAHGIIEIKNLGSTPIIIKNRTQIINSQNGLLYWIKISDEIQKISDSIQLEIKQGQIKESQFTGTGKELQSFILEDQFSIGENIRCWVNEEEFTNQTSLYDMSFNSKEFISKTSYEKEFGSRVDIFFGVKNRGYIPQLGDQIRIEYIIDDGESGNIPNETLGQFNFNEEIFNILGESVDTEQIKMFIIQNPQFGRNSESIEKTTQFIGFNSRSGVLAEKRNYQEFFKRYSIINKIGVQFDREFDIVKIIPFINIENKLNSGSDYFNLLDSQFLLDSNSKLSITQNIQNQFSQQIGQNLLFVDPEIKKYAVQIAYISNNNEREITLDNKIKEISSQFFIENQDSNFISKSKLIKSLQQIIGIESINVEFVSEENENAILLGTYNKIETIYINSIPRQQSTEIILNTDEDPQLGFDTLQNPILDENQLFACIGGFKSRTGFVFNSGIEIYKIES